MNDYSLFLSRFYKHIVVNINTIDNILIRHIRYNEHIAYGHMRIQFAHIPVGYFNTFQQDELVA